VNRAWVVTDLSKPAQDKKQMKKAAPGRQPGCILILEMPKSEFRFKKSVVSSAFSQPNIGLRLSALCSSSQPGAGRLSASLVNPKDILSALRFLSRDLRLLLNRGKIGSPVVCTSTGQQNHVVT